MGVRLINPEHHAEMRFLFTERLAFILRALEALWLYAVMPKPSTPIGVVKISNYCLHVIALGTFRSVFDQLKKLRDLLD